MARSRRSWFSPPRPSPRRLRVERLEDRAAPAVFTWDGRPDAGGTSPNASFATGANWVGDVAPPTDGSADLVFPATVAAGLRFAFNGFPAGAAFNSISLSGGYTITGSPTALNTNGL